MMWELINKRTRLKYILDDKELVNVKKAGLFSRFDVEEMKPVRMIHNPIIRDIKIEKAIKTNDKRGK